ncbi:MAG: NAD(P)-dependent oxidoreductase [Gemmatimonadales bacterium]|nr:NAD(P)-dependent oxidoreductase [Gemmatimonadales bacterium]
MNGHIPALSGTEVMVTGASGFLGSAVVRDLVNRGARVTAVLRASSNPWRLAPVDDRIVRWVGSLDELAGRRDAPVAAVVVHCAASGVDQRFSDVRAMVETNVRGTLQILEHAARVGAGRFVHVGTSGEYGAGVMLDEAAPLCPTSEYGATRAAATLLARAFGNTRGLDVTVVRPFAVYGPFEAAYRLIPHCILNTITGRPVEISMGTQTRDYVHVDDVAAGIALACAVPEAKGKVFNLCTGVETTVLDAAREVVALAGGAMDVVVGARPDIPGEMWRTSGSPQFAREVLGWMPGHELGGGLSATVDWFRRIGTLPPEYSRTT